MNPPIRSRAELVTWIESCVLGDLRTLLAGVDAYYAPPRHVSGDGRPIGAANFLFSLPRRYQDPERRAAGGRDGYGVGTRDDDEGDGRGGRLA